jgi:protein O-mannosyl-transferase
MGWGPPRNGAPPAVCSMRILPVIPSRWALAGLLVALVVVAWAGGLHGDFVLDDGIEIVGNRTVRTLDRWEAGLGAGTGGPLVVLTWAVEWRLWGADPFGYHVVNVLVHALNAVLALFLGEEVFGRLGARRPHLPALAAAALWALHPMTTEAVTHLAGLTEALAGTFCLAAVLGWLRGWREGRIVLLALSFLAFLAGMTTHPLAAAVPLLILLCEAVLPSGHPRRALPWLAPHLLVVGIAAAAGMAVRGAPVAPLWTRPAGEQVVTQAEVVSRTLGLWLLPVGQSAFHDVAAITDLTGPRALSSLALAGLLGALAVLVGRRHPWVALAAGWFGIALLPSSLLPLPGIMAERRAYLAGWGLCAGASALFLPAGARWPRVTGLLAAAVVLALGAATGARQAVWDSDVALWREAVQRQPGSAVAWTALGDALREDAGGAETAYRTAIRLDGDRPDAWSRLGSLLADAGRVEEARSLWMQVLRRRPTSCEAYDALGELHVRQRAWTLAAGQYRSALAWCPSDVRAHLALGHLHWGPLGDPALAAWHYQQVLALDPGSVEAPIVRERLLGLTR